MKCTHPYTRCLPDCLCPCDWCHADRERQQYDNVMCEQLVDEEYRRSA